MSFCILQHALNVILCSVVIQHALLLMKLCYFVVLQHALLHMLIFCYYVVIQQAFVYMIFCVI